MPIHERDLEGREPKNTKLVDPTEPDPELPQSEEQAILLEGGNPNLDPNELMQSVNARVMDPSIKAPTRVLRMLPLLRNAANDPSLPVTVRDMYRTVVLSIESRQKNVR